MRLASRVLRDVQLKRPIPSSRVSFLLLCSRPCTISSDIRRFDVSPMPGIRSLSISSIPDSTASDDLLLTELSLTSTAPPDTRLAPRQPTHDSLVLETKAFRKWSALLTDPARLAFETDFFRQGPAKKWRSRLLVDKFENRGDLALWSCLLDYQMRINGSAGVVHIWKGLWGRKSLHDVDSPLAQVFWRVILDGALASNDPSILDNIWIYSEWMYDLHGVKWPHLYVTIMKHFLRTHQHKRVMQWQLRLAPNFYPGSEVFADIIMQFAADEELYRVDTLVSLYRVNPDHNIYNRVIPYLYELGASSLARRWRRACIPQGDVPIVPPTAPVRTFLRFMEGYYPTELRKREKQAVAMYTPDAVKDEDIYELSQESMNRIQRRTLGITVKNYNDRLGAKWFASSWVGLDMAISTVSALGFEKIGPLSLQSIALRAGTTEGVLNRISQLQENGISVVDSNYYHIVVHIAKQKDDDLLRDLLQSDFHPDIFDDLELQTRLIHSVDNTGDWRTLRLLMVARLVVFERSSQAAANSILRLHFQRRDLDGVLRILKDMQASNIRLNHEQTDFIFENLIIDHKNGNNGGNGLPRLLEVFYLSIFRQFQSMDVPVPPTHWRLLLLNMARNGRLESLERLCLDLVDLFLTSPSLRPGFVPVHIDAVPQAMRVTLGGVENLLGVYVPQDLPVNHSLHPLRRLFNGKLITEMIESAFIAHKAQGFRLAVNAPPGGRQTQLAQISTVIRLLRILHDRGLPFHLKIKSVLTNCLVSMYGLHSPIDPSHRMMKASNTLTLREMKTFIDKAWGGTLLEPIEKLAITIYSTQPPWATLDSRPSGDLQRLQDINPKSDEEQEKPLLHSLPAKEKE